jgi:hypothetical protein
MAAMSEVGPRKQAPGKIARHKPAGFGRNEALVQAWLGASSHEVNCSAMDVADVLVQYSLLNDPARFYRFLIFYRTHSLRRPTRRSAQEQMLDLYILKLIRSHAVTATTKGGSVLAFVRLQV